jgi:uncharacterized protein (TIGR03032 family)
LTDPAEWAAQDELWRRPEQVATQWAQAGSVDRSLLRHRVRGDWWDVLADAGLTLLVSREYEHLLLALGADGAVSYLPLPHPSGIAVNHEARRVHVASTRNPNQIVTLAPATAGDPPEPVLMPATTRFLPGALYLHDLAFVGGRLHGNASNHNAVVELRHDGSWERAWWPKAIERAGKPQFDRNYIQLNSIAAGSDLEGSFFTASSAEIGRRRPGQLSYPVDRRGVVFSGRTREPVAEGLTRPHSARLHAGRLWVDNSGYGELGAVEDGAYEPVARLPGWTRGLFFHGDVAFVGTSRVIPRFHKYAPGLDQRRSVCGVHAVSVASGELLGSIVWPSGNQVFAVEGIPATLGSALPCPATRGERLVRDRFFSFRLDDWD